MSNDVYLTASTDDPLSGSPGKVTYIGCGRTEGVALFWLCCFRPEDQRITETYDCGPSYCCQLEKGIRQFKAGMQILLEVFPLTEEKNPSLMFLAGKFVEELEKSGAQFLSLESWQCDDRFAFREMVNHAIDGFHDPGIKKQYQARDRECWDKSYALPAESGVMTWAGVLRRLITTWYTYPKADYDEESDDLFNWVLCDDDAINRATNGIGGTDYEFLENLQSAPSD